MINRKHPVELFSSIHSFQSLLTVCTALAANDSHLKILKSDLLVTQNFLYSLSINFNPSFEYDVKVMTNCALKVRIKGHIHFYHFVTKAGCMINFILKL